MSDKIQKIKQEIERLKHNTPNAYDLSRFMLLEEIESFIDSLPKEPASKDLEEEIDNYFKDWTFDDEMSVMVKPNHYFAEFNDIKEIARHFAEWQKQEDFKELLKSDMSQFKECYEKGKFDMREEMMKDAVEGEVVYQIGNSVIAPTDIRYKVMSDRVYIPNVKLGDKVKIIIVKEEQQ